MANIYTDMLKLRMPAFRDSNWDDEINDNALIVETLLASIKQGNSVVSGLAPSDGGGLDVAYAAGIANVGGTLLIVSVSSKTCTSAVKNWLYVNSAGTVIISTTAPTGVFLLIALIDAGAASIDRIADLRYFNVVGHNPDWSFWGLKNLRMVEPHASDHTKVTINPSVYQIPIIIGAHSHIITAAVHVSSVDDLDTGALAAGTDYYVYACTDGTTLSYLVSANATNPAGFDADHSRKIGGFHTLCTAVGTIGGHTLTDYAQKDILPASVWCLKHRAKTLVNVGMVYDSGIQKWVDIYMASGTGTSTTSANGAAASDTRDWNDFVDDGNAVGKRLPTDSEFQSFAAGSNEETNISTSADPVTTGGHSDTAARRMISNIGCEDCCGAWYQWLQDQSAMYDDAVAAGWYDLPGSKGQLYRPVDTNDVKLLAGGVWYFAASCGSRSRLACYYRWFTYANVGARFVAEPL